MFTGIISGIGRIVAVEALGVDDAHGKRLTLLAPPGYLDDARLGDSIALNGACMTLTSLDAEAQRFTIDISAESLSKTAGLAEPGAVNLEKALRANDRLGGHLVSGHVDGVGEVTRFVPVGESWELRVRAPAALARFLAVKGSITVNGVSLTVNDVADVERGCEFGINLIPHTLEQTTLGGLTAGTRVNLEIDLIARYVERMLGRGGLPGASSKRVDRHIADAPLDLHRRQRREVCRGQELRLRRAAHQNRGAELLVQRLDARRDVHRVADERIGHPLVAADVAGNHRATVDADAVPQRGFAGGHPGRVERLQPRAHRARCGHRSVRVACIRERRAEDGLDLVADELQHQASLCADRGVHFTEVGVEVGYHLGRRM